MKYTVRQCRVYEKDPFVFNWNELTVNQKLKSFKVVIGSAGL